MNPMCLLTHRFSDRFKTNVCVQTEVTRKDCVWICTAGGLLNPLLLAFTLNLHPWRFWPSSIFSPLQTCSSYCSSWKGHFDWSSQPQRTVWRLRAGFKVEVKNQPKECFMQELRRTVQQWASRHCHGCCLLLSSPTDLLLVKHFCSASECNYA